MTYNQNETAKEVLNEVLRLWPNNGYTKVHLGFILRQEGNHSAVVELMEARLETGEPGVHKRFFYALGNLCDRLGRRVLAFKIYEEAVKRELRLNVSQAKALPPLTWIV